MRNYLSVGFASLALLVLVVSGCGKKPVAPASTTPTATPGTATNQTAQPVNNGPTQPTATTGTDPLAAGRDGSQETIKEYEGKPVQEPAAGTVPIVPGGYKPGMKPPTQEEIEKANEASSSEGSYHITPSPVSTPTPQ